MTGQAVESYSYALHGCKILFEFDLWKKSYSSLSEKAYNGYSIILAETHSTYMKHEHVKAEL